MVAACMIATAVEQAAAQPANVSGAPAQVLVGPGSYSPPTVTIIYRHAQSLADSGAVDWSFQNASSSPMTVTDKTGLGLFDTGSRHSPFKFAYVFNWAGTYPFRSTTTGTVGGVRVDLVRKPGTAALGSAITFRWALSGRTNCVFDVEIKHQGQAHWSYMRFATTALSTTYTPKKTGWFEVRSRLRNKTTNRSSGFSPSVLVHIT